MNLSFHANVVFHDPVPPTHVVAVRLKSTNNTDPNCSCAWREAQAELLCNVTSGFPPEDHLYLAGSFEADLTEGYGDILRNCGLKELSYLASGNKFSRRVRGGRSVLWDTVWVNQAVLKSGYLDIMQFQTELAAVSSLHLNDLTFPMILYVHLPLTARWKKFEIAFTSIALPFAIAYFVWLLVYAKPRDANPYVPPSLSEE
jgi:hypothetical protein